MYYLLIALIFLLFLVSLRVFDFDFFAPSTAAIAIFLFCALEGLIEYQQMQYFDFTFSGEYHIILGLGSFLLFSALVQVTYRKTMTKQAIAGDEKTEKAIAGVEKTKGLEQAGTFQRYQRIDFPAVLIILAVIFCIGCCIGTYQFMRGVAVEYSGEGDYPLSQVINLYHYYHLSFDHDVNTPLILGLAQRVLEIYGIFSVYGLLYNIVLAKVSWKDIAFISGIIAWICQMTLLSNRGLFLKLMAITIYILYFFLKMRFHWSKKVDAITAIVGLVALILFLPLFIKLHEIVGRGAISREAALHTLTIYINGGIRDFDIYLRNPTFPEVFGAELFYGIYKSLHVFLNIGDNVQKYLEMVSLNGVGYSNIFTAFRRFYTVGRDAGIIFFSGLQGAIFTFGYLFNKTRLQRGEVCFNVLLFAYFSNTILYLPIEELFYSTNFSLGVPARILLMYVIYYIFFRKQLNKPVKKDESAG